MSTQSDIMPRPYSYFILLPSSSFSLCVCPFPSSMSFPTFCPSPGGVFYLYIFYHIHAVFLLFLSIFFTCCWLFCCNDTKHFRVLCLTTNKAPKGLAHLEESIPSSAVKALYYLVFFIEFFKSITKSFLS